jgi:hypothetical protein
MISGAPPRATDRHVRFVPVATPLPASSWNTTPAPQAAWPAASRAVNMKNRE